MRGFPLSLRSCTVAVHEPAAWLIPGDNAALWLEEICRWGMPMQNLRLFVVPKSLADRAPSGVLVTGAVPSSSCIRRALPYGQIAQRLYLPIDGVLDPAVSEQELRSVLLWDVQVLHPWVGLIGFRQDEAIRVADLLARPVRRPGGWDRAVAGVYVNGRLLAVEPEQMPTVQIVLDAGRDDIGSEAAEPLPADSEDSALGRMKTAAALPAVRALRFLALPGLPVGLTPKWMRRLADWAGKNASAMSASLMAARFKELQRLQRLFERDPDAALRHAIPIKKLPTRGTAKPSARLGPRNVEFSLLNLRRSRPGDSWFVPDDLRQTLTTRYRAAANRELNLGRYRRAAYIFAELLGDRAAAANVLLQGKYFHEAAALYQDIKDDRSAALCLEEGGLLAEAIALHVRLGNLEKAGDLSARLGREEDARNFYHEAVDKLIAAGAPVQAAQLLETKLANPDRALEVLNGGWPDSSNAKNCLAEAFALLGRLGRHEESARRVAKLRDQTLSHSHAEALTHVLSGIANGYPNHAVRAAASDATRVVAGLALASASSLSSSRALVEAVTRLAPEDRLLSRDANRYLAQRTRPGQTAVPKALQRAPTTGRREPKLLRKFRLPGNIHWDCATSSGETFFALGRTEDQSVLLRGHWDGTFQHRPWMGQKLPPQNRMLNAAPDANRVLLLGLSQITFGASLRLGPSDGFPTPCLFYHPSAPPNHRVLGGCHDESGTLWLSHASDNEFLAVSAFSTDGLIVATFGGIARPLETGQPVPVAVRNAVLFIACGNKLVQVVPPPNSNGLRVVRETELPWAARTLVVTPPFVRVRVAVTFYEGGTVTWSDGATLPFAHGLIEPVVAFTRRCALVAAGRDEARVYDTDQGKISMRCSFQFGEGLPLAVLPAAGLNQFGLLTSDGVMCVYELEE